MLTKEQVVSELQKHTLIGDGRIVFKVIDYTTNPFAPEKTAYNVCYSDIAGVRRKAVYYPNTVGFQWSR